MKFVALIFLSIAPLFANAITLYELTFDQPAAQAKVDAKFPFSKPILTKLKKFELGTVVLTDPVVVLTPESDRIGIRVHFVFTWKNRLLKSKPISGEAFATSKIRYDAAVSSFFLDDPSVDDLDVEHIASIGDQMIAEFINRKLPTWLAERGAIFKLEGDAKKAIGRNLLQDVKVRNGLLVFKLGPGEASPESTQTPRKSQVPMSDTGVSLWEYSPAL